MGRRKRDGGSVGQVFCREMFGGVSEERRVVPTALSLGADKLPSEHLGIGGMPERAG